MYREREREREREGAGGTEDLVTTNFIVEAEKLLMD